MSQIFIGGIAKSPEEVERFNRELRFNREFAVARRVDEIKRQVLQERRQRERLAQRKRSKNTLGGRGH